MQRYEYEDAVLRSGLSASAIRILFIYASECIWKYGHEVYLAYSKFAEYGVSKRTRDEWVPKLREAGWLRDTGKTAGRGGCDIYELTIPELVQESSPVPESAPVELVQVSGELVRVSDELVQVHVGTSADLVALNSETNTDINTESNTDTQPEDFSSRELPTQPCESSSGDLVNQPGPSASGDFLAPAGTPPGPATTELEVQRRMHILKKREEQYGIRNTDEQRRLVVINQMKKERCTQ